MTCADIQALSLFRMGNFILYKLPSDFRNLFQLIGEMRTTTDLRTGEKSEYLLLQEIQIPEEPNDTMHGRFCNLHPRDTWLTAEVRPVTLTPS